MTRRRDIVRREFLRRSAAAALAMPLAIKASAFGAQDRITMGCIGMGGQGRGDMGGFPFCATSSPGFLTSTTSC